MTDDRQPGVRIDGELWDEFREEVRHRRGSVRGHLKHELEAALREYIEGGQPTGDQINARLQRIEDAVGADATTVGINDGPAAGQEIPHLHVHIVPRSEGDGGGPIHAVMGEQLDVQDNELSEIAEAISAGIE